MHQRHLTAEITELIARTSIVGPTGVSKYGSWFVVVRDSACLALANKF